MFKMTRSILLVTFLTQAALRTSAFSMPMFTEHAALKRTTPSKTEGVEIELPNFDELFSRIKEVSPLAKMVIDTNNEYNVDCFTGGDSVTSVGSSISNSHHHADLIKGGFQEADAKFGSKHKWSKIEENPRKTVHKIDKIDNFQKLGCPIVRFRSSLQGPCSGNKFASFIMDLEERAKWDPQIEMVDELYPIYDVDAANIAMDFQYGDCQRLGIGYCRTKSNPIVDGREQLILCGIQEFENGASVIWGTELEEYNNHLFPDCPRRTRAKSHLFSTTLVPTGPDSFDVEYVLQLEIGGKIPSFLTTPILVETVKSMFGYAEKTFKDEEIMKEWIKPVEELKDVMIQERHGLLMTP